MQHVTLSLTPLEVDALWRATTCLNGEFAVAVDLSPKDRACSAALDRIRRKLSQAAAKETT